MNESYKNSEKGKSLKAQEDGHTLAVRSGVTLFVPATQLATTYALQPLTLAPVMPALGWIGLGVGAAGLLLETIADEQKLAAKSDRPNDPVMTGTYTFVRHPNYLGEILFWAGVLVGAQASLPQSALWTHRFGGSFGPPFDDLGDVRGCEKIGHECKVF